MDPRALLRRYEFIHQARFEAWAYRIAGRASLKFCGYHRCRRKVAPQPALLWSSQLLHTLFDLCTWTMSTGKSLSLSQNTFLQPPGSRSARTSEENLSTGRENKRRANIYDAVAGSPLHFSPHLAYTDNRRPYKCSWFYKTSSLRFQAPRYGVIQYTNCSPGRAPISPKKCPNPLSGK